MTVEDSQTLKRLMHEGFLTRLKYCYFRLRYNDMFGENRPTGFLRKLEGTMLYRLASSLRKGSLIVEIGVYNGTSTCYLAAGARNSGSLVISIDPFDSRMDIQIAQVPQGAGSKYLEEGADSKPSKQKVQDNLAALGLDIYVQLIEGFSNETADEWRRDPRPIDLLFIDANHTQAKQDYSAWRTYLKNGARVAFHDAVPRLGRGTVPNDVERIISEEHIKGLMVVKSIVSFCVQKNSYPSYHQ